ncbi:MAG: TOBE domain-containing protein [Ancalomicrobiaceae bacterium]|nr:TOBE domain-containing protein [Ancalomicrobiaceae bacterium]
MSANRIDATLALKSAGRFLVGRDRIRLLEAVAQYGSITTAAKETGFSYKTAWEAVNAINNLLPTPAFVTKAGGRAGGGAEVTEEGLRLIATFRRLEERLSQFSSIIAEEGLDAQDEAMLRAAGLRISTRNVFRAEVVAIDRSAVDVDVTMQLTADQSIHSIVTNGAADDLQLAPGRRVLALVKAPFIDLGPVDGSGAFPCNRFRGTIVSRIDSDRSSEIRLAIGDGKTLLAVLTLARAEELGLVEGGEAAATFDPSHVILVAD